MTPTLEQKIEAIQQQLEDIKKEHDISYVLHVEEHKGSTNSNVEVHNFRNGSRLEEVVNYLLYKIYPTCRT